MSYPFDPELAAAVAMMPAVEMTDIPAARAQRGEMYAAASGEPDRTGVQVRDELVAGPDGAPDVRLRIYTPDRGCWRPRRSTTSTAAASCSARSRCSTGTTCTSPASSA